MFWAVWVYNADAGTCTVDTRTSAVQLWPDRGRVDAVSRGRSGVSSRWHTRGRVTRRRRLVAGEAWQTQPRHPRRTDSKPASAARTVRIGGAYQELRGSASIAIMEIKMPYENTDYPSTIGVLWCLNCVKFVFLGWGSSRRSDRLPSRLGKALPIPRAVEAHGVLILAPSVPRLWSSPPKFYV